MVEPRIIDLAESPARVSCRNRTLVVALREGAETVIPLPEIGLLAVSHPQVSISQPALAALAEAGAAVLVCNEKRLPAAMLLPLDGHHLQTERIQAQAVASKPLRKRLWQTVVRAKLAAQARLLDACDGSGRAVSVLIPDVRSGDPTNVEAQAARRYWGRLVASGSLPGGFRRDRQGDWPNALFNYAYAVVRAVVARALCAAGLHPSLGLHHRNRYNAFCLADDLVEPLRPLADRVVLSFVKANPGSDGISREARQAVLEAVLARYATGGELRTLFDIMARACVELAHVYTGKLAAQKWRFPEIADDRPVE